jgi:3-methyl-2-oxobutanoate hydroxymethyltransferase
VADIVRNLVDFGIPVMGHIGLTPQSINQLGGYSIQGKEVDAANRLVQDALSLEKAGAFALVLELIPSSLAQTITSQISIPTIGIGAGPYCDGQVQVFHDMFGFSQDAPPRHARQYADLGKVVTESISTYIEEVENGSFGPNPP